MERHLVALGMRTAKVIHEGPIQIYHMNPTKGGDPDHPSGARVLKSKLLMDSDERKTYNLDNVAKY